MGMTWDGIGNDMGMTSGMTSANDIRDNMGIASGRHQPQLCIKPTDFLVIINFEINFIQELWRKR